MKIYIASDHGAYEAKSGLVEFLKQEYSEDSVIDLGTDSTESCNYPEYAIALARSVVSNNAIGVLLCGSGIGVSVVANKFKGITAALCRSEEDAKLSRQHNNANVICFGGRVTPIDEMKKMLKIWLSTEFEGGRHETRTKMFENLGSDINEA
jgi:ribose 5-phosphate isomerase B